MRIDKKNNDAERRILIGMIVDSIVLGRIAAKWQPRSFKSKWSNIVARWCLDYYERYNKAPMKHVEGLFEHWSEKTKDKTNVELVRKFLATLSNEYENLKSESNSDYVIDIAARHFNQVKIESLVEEIETDISEGQPDRAHDRLVGYSRIEMGVGAGVDVLHDVDVMRKAFDAEKTETLIKFPGALGEFFKGTLERENFISFMGKKGVGKSYWLMTMAYEAMLQRRRVAMFEVGDMGESQTMRRFLIRVSRQPRYPCDVYYPTKIYYSEKKRKVVRDFDLREYTKRLSWRKAAKACDRVLRKKVKSKESYLKLSCHFNSTLSVNGIESMLQNWEREGWIPEVIVIDYADILKMKYAGIEGRDRIDETWKQLRQLSQRRHCLLITATQSDVASYDRGTMKMDNFTDDRRKIDSVRGMIGINQTEQEKKKGITRLNWVALNDHEFQPSKCVHVAGCLAIANPAIQSCFK
jgi:replicative DNA helicase